MCATIRSLFIGQPLDVDVNGAFIIGLLNRQVILQPFFEVSLCCIWFYWVLPSCTGFQCVVLGSNGFNRVLKRRNRVQFGLAGLYRVLPSLTGFPLGFIEF